MKDKLILIVEDNDVNSYLVEKILSFYQYQSIIVKDGESAINWCKQNSADLVLLDISLPNKDGLEVAAELRENPTYQKTPIVALTAHAMVGWKEKCLAAGCCDYITKPFRPKEIINCIEKHIETIANSKI